MENRKIIISEGYWDKIKCTLTSDEVKLFGRISRLEGEWKYAYWIKKEEIEKELRDIAIQNQILTNK